MPVRPRLEQFCRDVLGPAAFSARSTPAKPPTCWSRPTPSAFSRTAQVAAGLRAAARGGGLKANAVPQIVPRGRPGPRRRPSAIGMVTSVFAMTDGHREGQNRGHGLRGRKQLPLRRRRLLLPLLAAKAGLFGMAMANDTPSMVVPRLRKAVLGTNPFAYAVPAGQRRPDLPGHRLQCRGRRQGPRIPGPQQTGARHWLVDTEGVPTTDPFAYPFAGLAAAVCRPQGLRHRTDDRNPRRHLERGGHARGDPELDRQRCGGRRRHGAALWPSTWARSCPARRFASASTDDSRHPQTPRPKGGADLFARRNGMGSRREALTGGISLPADVRENLLALARIEMEPLC